jgi:hypothetical protein
MMRSRAVIVPREQDIIILEWHWPWLDRIVARVRAWRNRTRGGRVRGNRQRNGGRWSGSFSDLHVFPALSKRKRATSKAAAPKVFPENAHIGDQRSPKSTQRTVAVPPGMSR